MRIAVVLFAYNRPEVLKKTIKNHYKVEELDYFCFIDHSDKQTEVLKIVEGKYDYVIPRHTRYGLNKNIIGGINALFEGWKYDALVVLEEDLLVAVDSVPYLLYRLEHNNYKHFSSISLCKGKIFDETFRCWGWATWKDRWDLIKDKLDINGKSWDLQVDELWRKEKLFCFCSPVSKVKHIANGEHYKWYSKFGIRQYAKRLRRK